MSAKYDEQFAFYEHLRAYYLSNRRKIRSDYRELTKKFLAYNDFELNQNAFLRPPQFEALEMYVFVKEFMNNAPMHEIFNLWRKHEGDFSDLNDYSAPNTNGQLSLTNIGDIVDLPKEIEKQTDMLFKQMKKYREEYPNYIYALTMGLGKTILMATCIFYEFLLSATYPKDKRFCHNALVFAPDKTVLQSLREIVTFDKAKVLPPEYANRLDINIKFHFLDDAETTLQTTDKSDYNIIITNTQKIIVKRKHKEDNTAITLFEKGSGSILEGIYGDNVLSEEETLRESDNLTVNQRFKKLCRLTQLGIYVDEAHHLFGADLEKQLRSNSARTSLRSTINMLAADLKSSGGSVVACYNYTGTPYVANQVLPEVIYAYGLKESIRHNYLKDCNTLSFANVKNEQFLIETIKEFWKRYGGQTYEGLMPKLAIFAAEVAEAVKFVRPAVEKVLAELGIPLSSVLVNVGDTAYTKEEDIRHFNNLDVAGTEGSQKQFLILVNKGREGWNCRSLFGVALFRSPKSKIFVLQATMRCLRKITDEQQTATVFLSEENYEILDAELKKNFNMDIKDLKDTSKKNRARFQVRVLAPPSPVKLTLHSVKQEYTLEEKEYISPVDFGLSELDLSGYIALKREKRGITSDRFEKEDEVDTSAYNARYSLFTLVGEVSRYLNISPVVANRIISESADGAEKVVDFVSKYNDILIDIIIPKIFNLLFELKKEVKSEEHELTLLKEPKGAGYYEFLADRDLVIDKNYPQYENWRGRSFHADTYCFDSKPEKVLFLQYVEDTKRVSKIYFTGMFTSEQGDFSIRYYDPESGRVRRYYPDFFAIMSDGSYQIIEVKGDNKIDDPLVKIKEAAAKKIASKSGVEYVMYAGSVIMKHKVLERDMSIAAQLTLLENAAQ
ncbi:MAG: DEAD/DEAH box helicase family protein [Oscillospiraceae bacterium]|jgi:hypothetical protein|nr:DEAD/DEAH box helicase family protein [Oscillospiraceae bacterium]